MVNGAPPSELSGPLAQLWRSVYKKAAALAETRTGELLRDHVYLFHRTAGGGLTQEQADDLYVNETGDTMTGTLVFDDGDGTAVDTGGAVVVHGPATVGTAVQLYGPDSPVGDPTATWPGNDWERGIRFEASSALTLTAVRWYRAASTTATPPSVRLWDSTAPGTPVWSATAPSEWADTALGWKTHPLPEEEQPTLVPGRVYALGYAVNSGASGTQTGDGDYVPVPSTGLTFLAHVNAIAGGGNYPGETTSVAWFIDGIFGGDLATSPAPAAIGAIRLPNGAAGAIAWRNGTDTGDNTLYADAADELLYNGEPLGGGGGGGGDFLPLAGGTMTGTVAFTGAAVASGGAIRVTGSATTPASRRLYGPGGATFSPLANVSGDGFEFGLRFTSGIAQKLVAVRWYRASTATAAPALPRLWDTTTSSTVWSEANPTEWTSSTLGWLEHPVPAGTQPTLVAGRDYILSYGVTNFVAHHTGQNGYTPVPEADLTFVGHRYGSSSGSYPSNTHTYAFGIDGVFQALAAGTASPAQSGAIRLPNGNDGRLAWRNAADTADLALTVSSGNALTFDGNPVAVGSFLPLAGGTLTGDLVVSEATPTVSLKLTADTQPRSRLTDTALGFGPGGSTAPDATLSRTGPGAMRADTHLGVGVNPAAFSAANPALQVGQAGVVKGSTADTSLQLTSNAYHDGAWKAITTGAASLLSLSGNLSVYTAPSTTAGAAPAFTVRANIAPTGTLTLTPDAGQFALVVNPSAGQGAIATGNSQPLLLQASGVANVQVAPQGGYFHPYNDGGINCGAPNLRWLAVYAVAGAINTSSREYKEGITPLNPSRAMAAVRNTEAVTFDYVAPTRTAEWYDLPDDPEQAEAVLAQRLTAAPLEAAARHQSGFVAEQADSLFLVGEGQTSPGNSVGVLLAALQHIDQRLSALEGA